jgi:hypothetical protein
VREADEEFRHEALADVAARRAHPPDLMNL